MTHSHVWRDEFFLEWQSRRVSRDSPPWTWLVHMWDVTISYVWDTTHSHVWHGRFVTTVMPCVTSGSCVMSHVTWLAPYGRDSFIRGTWLFHMCETWLIHMCDITHFMCCVTTRALYLSHTYTHTLSLAHTTPVFFSLSFSLTHIHTHTLSLSLSHTHSLSRTAHFFVPLSDFHTRTLSHTYTHTLSLAYSTPPFPSRSFSYTSGVATISRLFKIIGLFCRTSSLL